MTKPTNDRPSPRRDALVETAAFVGRVLPIRDDSSHHSTQRRLGVEIDGIAGLAIECIVIGRRREDEALVLMQNITGLSSEAHPLYRYPPFQGQRLLDAPIRRRMATGTFEWTRPEDEIAADIVRCARAVWASWCARAAAAFARDPSVWVRACEWIAISDDPACWLASGWDVRGRALLRAVPMRADDVDAGGWSVAWLGFADVLDGIVQVDAISLERIRAAARVTRARIAARHADLDATDRDTTRH